MNKTTIIKVQNITKVYKLYNKPIDRVKESLSFSKKKYHKEFHALENVSFELKKGEALGIIGKNGNGKSTLLKVIAGVLTPTKGHVNTRGRISAILELTSNLKQELTGLENIELNLKISGFKAEKLKNKIKEIEEFAEIGEFINQPVKLYSSGMKSRLGFGIATASEPDILILDEVLAVGDFSFKQKCMIKINNMRNSMSIIFVSHSMNDIRTFCNNCLVLEKGKKVFYGEVDDAIKFYLEREEKKKPITKKLLTVEKHFYGELTVNNDMISNISHEYLKSSYELNEKIILNFEFYLNKKPRKLLIGVPIWDSNGNYITSINSDLNSIEILNNGKIKGSISFNNILNPGEYVSVLSISDSGIFLYRGLCKRFYTKAYPRTFGYVTLTSDWKLNND